MPRDKKSKASCGHVPDAINVLDVFCIVVILLFQLLAKHSSAALPCKRFVNKRMLTHKQFVCSL